MSEPDHFDQKYRNLFYFPGSSPHFHATLALIKTDFRKTNDANWQNYTQSTYTAETNSQSTKIPPLGRCKWGKNIHIYFTSTSPILKAIFKQMKAVKVIQIRLEYNNNKPLTQWTQFCLQEVRTYEIFFRSSSKNVDQFHLHNNRMFLSNCIYVVSHKGGQYVF